ncbi:MAG: Dyp-type peroxidase [Humibacillus sp.]|nr:Dyp-type peroxidase [Humibacillus sp.]MDN5779862.1 Dyp-type peroxidase [Humibacillus sp.]
MVPHPPKRPDGDEQRVIPSAGSGHGPGRRAVLRGGLVAAAGIATTGAVAGCQAGSTGSSADASSRPAAAGPVTRASTITFRGARQAGVVTEPQPFAAFVGLDLPKGADRDTCQRLMGVWTDDIERLMAARGPLTDLEPELAQVPSRLTVTVGVGSGFYAAAGLVAHRPNWLAPLPRFGIDRLDPTWRQTDVVLQVRADSPVAVAHATRRLVVGADTLASQVWVQRGFREPLTETDAGLPFRNQFGQIDGTVQPATDGTHDPLLWIGADQQAPPKGLAGGSSMVIRRIAMNMDTWDRADRIARENAIGRRLDNGAPLTGTKPTDHPDLQAKDALGFPVIDDASHLRRAMPAAPHEHILRAPYSYDDPPAGTARTNTGLVFVAFQADPVRQFVPIQRRLAEADLMNIWTTPIGSSVYAVLPGAGSGETLGQALLS